MARPTTATIDLTAFRHNYKLAKTLANGQHAVAIIKADAYGHGAVKMAHALEEEADAFGVACIEEALELRQSGITQPILLLEGFFSPDELPLIAANNFWCAVHSVEQIEYIAHADLESPITTWLKMDCGMHRLGIPPKQYQLAYQKLKALSQVEKIVCMSHFSSADTAFAPDNITHQQIQRCQSIFDQLDADISLANSAATLGYPEARQQYLRPGIMLYGASPYSEPHPLADQLQPVMTLHSEIIAIRDVPINEAIGYGQRFVCSAPTKVGTVAIGYADGYPRHAKDGTPIIVNGQRTRIIGRVSMDMLTVDLTHVTDVKIGSTVELWGKHLLATEVAEHCDTIAYTLFTGITRRVHKRYIT
ncbi:alanine racemase [Vibrio hibernica]|uniref:alanine racemase n=1 Tax=Vibrio hibernica TaxID=2587465 RepID=UPI0039AF4407